MKLGDIDKTLTETMTAGGTGAGGIAGAAHPMGAIQTRGTPVKKKKKKKKVSEDPKCTACGDTGTVYWDHQDEFTGDHLPAKAD